MRLVRRGRGNRIVSALVAVLVIVVGILLMRQLKHSYYDRLTQTANAPETAPLDTP